MADEYVKHTDNVHGHQGLYCAGEWIDIEECARLKEEAHKKCADCSHRKKAETRPRAKSGEQKPNDFDVVVIGAGCVGSMVARELSKTTLNVCLLEKADDVTQGATKGNSGIVHAGYDDKPGSVRAKFCWAGNQMYSQLDAELRFGFQKVGSLVVARGKEQEGILDELMERADLNGVKNCRIVQQEELREMVSYASSKCYGRYVPYNLLSPSRARTFSCCSWVTGTEHLA